MNSKVQFPLGFFHPTTIVFVDDEPSFFRNLELSIPKNLLFRFFSDPVEASEYLAQTCVHSQHALPESILGYHGRFGADTLVRIDLGSIEGIMTDPARFARPTVLVCDYAMPEMNGLEVCEVVSSNPIRKILLTGQADERVGLSAFNAGLIDRFIMKSQRKLEQELFEHVRVLQNQFFVDMQNELITTSMGATHLFHPPILQAMTDYAAREEFVEWYLATDPSGYIFVRSDGSMVRLFPCDEAWMQASLSFARTSGAPDDIIAGLQRRTHVLSRYESIDVSAPADYPWRENCLPCEAIPGAAGVWMAYDQDPPVVADYIAAQCCLDAAVGL